MSFPVFASGDVLNASDMNGVGLWLVKSQTVGSGVASVTVTSAFSADYDNYLITISGGTGSTSSELRLRFGAAATNYKFSFTYTTYASTPLAVGSAAATAIDYVGQATSSSIGANIFVQNPFLTEHTFASGACTTELFAGQTSGYLNTTTSYTDFTVLTGTGTLTGGTIRVYGIRN